MAVRKDASGRRWIQVEVDVPGTPAEVWQAIATGPGISAWFVPTDVEEREGGAIVANFGPGMEAHATVTSWEPPRRFATTADGMTPGGPPLATEWIVEAHSGGTCTVRVVHSLFASNEDWDDQLKGTESGWPRFFRILRLYLEHFRGQRCVPLQLIGTANQPADEAWRALTAPLGLARVGAGQRYDAPAGAPALSGQVEYVGDPPSHDILIRLDEPGPGLLSLCTFEMGDQLHVYVDALLYGTLATASAERLKPAWQTFLEAHFPSSADGQWSRPDA